MGWLEKGEWVQFSLGSDEFEDPVPTRNKIPISRSTITAPGEKDEGWDFKCRCVAKAAGKG